MSDVDYEKFTPYACQVCGAVTIKYDFDICENCGWENTGYHEDCPDETDMNGDLTLNQAREQWKKFGKIDYKNPEFERYLEERKKKKEKEREMSSVRKKHNKK